MKSDIFLFFLFWLFLYLLISGV